MNCKVMGIVNVTPDSFSDGGKFYAPEEAVRRALNMIDEGADFIDVGGESTRPGATPIGWKEEWERIGRVVEGIVTAGDVVVSVDTYHPETAERAIQAGVRMINCVYAERISDMIRVINDAAQDIELVMPASALDLLAGTTFSFYLDPMIGFGTTREEDLERLRSVPELAKKGRVLVGASRKRIVKRLTGEKVTGKNLGGNLGIALWCAAHGAAVVRVHDVRETVQALRTFSAMDGSV